MACIELDKLIVRQTYLIPVDSSELANRIFMELISFTPEINGLYSWGLVEAHKSSFHFQCNTKYAFLYAQVWGKKLTTQKMKKMIEEKERELERLGDKAAAFLLSGIVSTHPFDIYVLVINREKNTCTCKVECLPALYEKLRLLSVKPTDFEIQAAFLSCRRLLESIFQSGLSATLLSEERKEQLRPVAQLLINDQHSRQIFDKIEEMFEHATGEILVCGWIGTLFISLLKKMKEKGISIRVVTHKAAQLKGQIGHQDIQRAYSELIPTIGKDHISIRPECHFRAVIVDDEALIGSMDLNAVSLTGTNRELAIFTDDPEIVRNLRDYFNRISSPLAVEG